MRAARLLLILTLALTLTQVGSTTITRCVPRDCSSGDALASSLPFTPAAFTRLWGRPNEAGCGCDTVVLLDGYTVTCILSLIFGIAWSAQLHPHPHVVATAP